MDDVYSERGAASPPREVSTVSASEAEENCSVFAGLARVARAERRATLSGAGAGPKDENSGLIDLKALSARDCSVTPQGLISPASLRSQSAEGARDARRRSTLPSVAVRALGVGLLAAAAYVVGRSFSHSVAPAEERPNGGERGPVTSPRALSEATPSVATADPSGRQSPLASVASPGTAARRFSLSPASAAARAPATREAKPSASVPVAAEGAMPSAPLSLEDEMQRAVGGGAAPAAPPSSEPLAVASPPGLVHPSQGQIASAMAAVMPGARACFEPDSPISNARILFASSGVVRSTTITGYAAGKPAEACVRTALGEARLPPFSQSSFEVRVTIRP